MPNFNKSPSHRFLTAILVGLFAWAGALTSGSGTESPREVWISFRTDGQAGSGTAIDPFDGSTAAKFDAVMRSLAVEDGNHDIAPVTVHIGPGTFLTYGQLNGDVLTDWPEPYPGYKVYPDLSRGWQVYDGWKVL